MSARRISCRRAVSCFISAVVALGAAPSTVSAAAPSTTAPSAASGPKLTKPPKLVHFVDAPYPEREKKAGRAASVVLRLTIGKTGQVDEALVVESQGVDFDAAAVAAAKQFVFEPAEIDGAPASIRILYRYQFVLRQEKPTFALFSGTIRDRKSKVPLANVKVSLNTGESATTDAAGRFQFAELAAGKRTVSISGEHLTMQQTEEVLDAGQKVDATYTLDVKSDAEPEEEHDDLEIVVVAPPLQKKVVSTEVSAEQGRKVPGTQGDVLKVVESMPGVARSSAGSGQLVVWGAAPEDTRVYIEDVRVPRLYHNGGVRSVIHSDLVQSVELTPGGYGASYGRGLGGLVTVQMAPLEKQGIHGSVGLDVLDASAATTVRTGSWGFAIAGRKSHLDTLLDHVTSEDIGDFFPIPRYYDAQARLAYHASEHESVELGGLLSSDDISRTVASPDPAQIKRQDSHLGFQRIYVRYRNRTSDGGEVTLTPSFGVDRQSATEQFGATPAELSSQAEVYGLRTAYRGRLSPRVLVKAGLDVEMVSTALTRHGSVTSPAREGDVRVFGQLPSDQVNADEWSAVTGSVSPYGELDLAFADDNLHLVPGVRVEPFFVSASRRTPVVGDTPSIGLFDINVVVEPRLTATLEVAKGLVLKAGWGRYHQSPDPADLSPVFGNPTLGTATATHYLFGVKVSPAEHTSVESTVFYSSSAGLSVRNPSDSPPQAQALLDSGVGRSYGTQILIRQELSSRFFGWLSYSMLRSERANADGAPFRLFDFDQSHVLTAVSSYDLGRGFEIGARFRYATGYPRTPVLRAYLDSRTDSYVPVFGAQNSIRIPAFVQADVRLAKRFNIGATKLEAYLDVQNVTDRANPEEIVYSADYTQKRYITGLPILPVVGVQWSW